MARFPTFRSDPADVMEDASGRYRFAPGKRCNRLPLFDRVLNGYARQGQAHAEAMAARLGGRLATQAEIEQIARVAYFISPVIVRETGEETRERMSRGGTDPLERMATAEWCKREDAGIRAQLVGLWDGDRPVLNAGKHWIERSAEDRKRGVAVNMGWDTDPRVDVTKWIQTPGRAHNAGAPDGEDVGHLDYSQTMLVVWDEDKPSDPPRPMQGPGIPCTFVPPPAAAPVVAPKAKSVDDGYMPDAITVATKGEVFDALSKSLPEIPREGILVLLAHWSLETGAGRAMHRWNMGNIKHVAGDGRPWTMFRCSEIIGGRNVFFDPPHPQTWFRAYESLEAGAADYVATLRRTFSKAWPSVQAGDPRAFSQALKAQRYYTADEAQYTAVMVRLWNELDATVGFDVSLALSTLGLPDVRSFQRVTPGLVVDGIAGVNTVRALRVALARKGKPA